MLKEQRNNFVCVLVLFIVFIMDENIKNKIIKAVGFKPDGDIEKDLERIIDWQKKLKEIDISGVEPMYNTLGDDAVAITNEDEVKSPDGDVLANAPERDGDFFIVPKVIKSK